MKNNPEALILRGCVAILALIPVGAGLAGVIYGPMMAGGGLENPALDSHFRYLSGLLVAIGLGFWSTIPQIEKHTARFRLLTFIVFIGGLGRMTGCMAEGWPPLPMTGGLIMELIVTPLLCLWQRRISQSR